MLGAPSESKLQRLDARFHGRIAVLHDRLEALVNAEGFTFAGKPRGLTGKKAVYLFCDGDAPFYVGRTRNLGQRLGQHCNDGSQPNQSSVAFKLACIELSIERQKYTPGQNWKSLMAQNAQLNPAFRRWKGRMRDMCIRYVEEPDPVTQALLEIYCAVALNTPHNDFDTH
jgi:hypothetical protein